MYALRGAPGYRGGEGLLPCRYCPRNLNWKVQLPVVSGVKVVTAPPLASDENGPLVSTVPSGCVISRVMLVHLSPYCALAVGGGLPSQKLTLTLWPTPIGF